MGKGRLQRAVIAGACGCREFAMGSTVDDMQVACLWLGENLLTVSLSGVINYLDRACPETPRRILKVSARVTPAGQVCGSLTTNTLT